MDIMFVISGWRWSDRVRDSEDGYNERYVRMRWSDRVSDSEDGYNERYVRMEVDLG